MYIDYFKKSLTYIFKEKDWVAKVGFFLFVTSMQMLLSASYYFLSYEEYNPQTGDIRLSVLALPTVCISLFMGIFTIVILLFLQYENVQAAIQDRQTKAIWSYDLWNIIKKSFKYFISTLLLALPLIAIIVVTFIVGFIGIGISAIGGPLVILGIMLFCGLMALLVIGVIYYTYFFMVPSLLRLIATNTFSESLKMGENFAIGKKYWKHFGVILLVGFIVGLLIGFPSGIIGFITGLVFEGDQRLSSLVGGVLALPFTLLAQFFTTYCLSYFSGKLYLDILEKENITYAK